MGHRKMSDPLIERWDHRLHPLLPDTAKSVIFDRHPVQRNRSLPTGTSPCQSTSVRKATFSWWRQALHQTTRWKPWLPV